MENKTESKLKATFTLEKNLLHALANQEIYRSYRKYLPKRGRLLPTTSLLLRDYSRYFDVYPNHEKIDFEEFSSLFVTTWHSNDLVDEELTFYIENILPRLSEPPEMDYAHSLVGLFTTQMLEELHKVEEKGIDPEAAQKIIDDYQRKYEAVMGTDDEELKSPLDFEYEDGDYSSAIPYYLPTLQKELHGMLQGMLVVVNAASGAGKSAFVISQMVHTIKHLQENGSQQPIIHFSSEDHLPKLTRRIFSNLFADELPNGIIDLQDRDKYLEIQRKYQDIYASVPYKMCSIYDGMSVQKIKAKLERHKPALCVIDITDVLVDRGKGNEALQFKLLYDRLRQLSIQYCPILVTTQAGTSAAPKDYHGEKKYKLWLDSGDMYFSNEGGKDGAADTIIGIGMLDPIQPVRGIKIIKNKEGAGDIKFYCSFEGQYSRFKETGE
jgi:hypothetical protein